MKFRRPYGFIHDRTLIYFRFTGLDWFYPDPGYSDIMVKRSGYKFDGQFFYKEIN